MRNSDSLFDEFAFMENEGMQKENSLYNWCIQNGERGKILLEEWNKEKNINYHGITESMTDITYASCKKKHWICRSCGKDFQMPIASRTSGGQECPICSKKRGGKKNHENALENGNDLLSWCMNNGEFGKLLMQEWNENEIKMSDVTKRSKRKVHWKCLRCGEIFESSIDHRTREKSCCPHCNIQGTSYPEQFIYRGLKQIFKDTVNRAKLFNGIEYDIYIPSQNLCIEYGSTKWHEDKKDRDEMKRTLCEGKGIRFLAIESHNRNDKSVFSDIFISYKVNISKQDTQLKEILGYILTMLGHDIEEVDINRVINETSKFMFVEIENNIKELYPSLMKEWDESLNNGLKPEYFVKGSHKRIRWKCYNCKCVWSLSIKERIRRKSSCGRCGYNIFDNKIHSHAINQSKNVTLSIDWNKNRL